MQSKIDEFPFHRGRTLFMFYVDDGIFVSHDNEDITKTMQQELKDEKFDAEDMGAIGGHLGNNFDCQENGKTKLSQPHPINQILNQVKILNKKVKGKSTPAASSKILQGAEKEEASNDDLFQHNLAAGKLNFLEKYL